MSTPLAYRFKYVWGEKEAETMIEATGPIQALDRFHKWIQTTKETDSRKNVIRHPLKPHQYVLVSMAHVYHDAALHRNPSAQPLIDSVVDLPKSQNPDISKAKYDDQETPEFKFD